MKNSSHRSTYLPTTQSNKKEEEQQQQHRAQPSARTGISFSSPILLSLLLTLAFLASQTSSLPSFLQLNSNNPKKSTGFDEVFSFLGPYSPYINQPSAQGVEYELPEGCEVSQVNVLQRHGARYPTSGAKTLIQTALLKLKDIDVSSLPSDSLFRFLEGYEFKAEPDQLTDYGRKEAYDAGSFFSERYWEGFKDRKGVWVRSSGQERVVESGRFFMQGFEGKPFLLGNVSALPEVDMLVSEEEGCVNPLSVYTCEADNNLSPHPGQIAEREWLGTFGPAVAARINRLLPGANLSTSNILSLMSLCGFDSLRKVSPTTSPWCDVFTLEEWKQNEYYYDVSKYYAHAHGSPYGKVKGASFVNELVARLIDSEHVVQAGSSNMSLIGPPGGERIFVDFSHDNTMAEILAALEMLKDVDDLPTRPHPIPLHDFVVSKVVPFSGRFVFERITCSSTSSRFGRASTTRERTFVRTLINDAIQTTKKFGDGLVPLPSFLKTVSFAQGGGNWTQCEVPRI
ncbi:histidine phosphatase superfamily [Mrakia frigida]|uniref:histidine phosphatase family protein n=1 Tax=Mrakia frigida TaxID=29902 RepID=UPI003FCC2689